MSRRKGARNRGRVSFSILVLKRDEKKMKKMEELEKVIESHREIMNIEPGGLLDQY